MEYLWYRPLFFSPLVIIRSLSLSFILLVIFRFPLLFLFSLFLSLCLCFCFSFCMYCYQKVKVVYHIDWVTKLSGELKRLGPKFKWTTSEEWYKIKIVRRLAAPWKNKDIKRVIHDRNNTQILLKEHN